MKRLLSMAVLTLVWGCLTGSCFGAEILQQDSKPITVSYKNGDVEHYVVRWNGIREINHYEDGHPSEPFNGWFTDTRQCHWTINTRIERRVYLINHNGQEFVQEQLTTPHVENFANKGSDLVVTQLRPENCGDANARFQSDVSDSAKHMLQIFGPNVTKDFQSVISAMGTWPNLKSVQPK